MATALTEGTFNYTLANCKTLTTVDGVTYGTDTTSARGGYGIAVFLINKAVSGDNNQLMIGNNDNRLTDTFWTVDIAGGGVNELRPFIVPIFGSGITFISAGIIIYDITSNAFYKNVSASSVPATPDSNWTVIDETDVDLFLAEFNTAFFPSAQTIQKEGYYETTKYYEGCPVEIQLADMMLSLNTECHTACTMGEYERLRRSYEAGASYFTQKNYSQSQKHFEDANNHPKSS